MADFLTEEWFEAALGAAGGLPKVSGDDTDIAGRTSAIINFEVAGAPSGKLRAAAVLADGQLESFSIGKSKEATVDVVISAENAQAVLTGAMDPAVGYMRGDIKLGGAYEIVLFELQPLFGTDAWSAFVADVVSATEF